MARGGGGFGGGSSGGGGASGGWEPHGQSPCLDTLVAVPDPVCLGMGGKEPALPAVALFISARSAPNSSVNIGGRDCTGQVAVCFQKIPLS